jgi:predicted amidophosphoribosyltransferase
LIGLVDDVITTGATLNSCINTLSKAGAKRIMVLTVYRTPE